MTDLTWKTVNLPDVEDFSAEPNPTKLVLQPGTYLVNGVKRTFTEVTTLNLDELKYLLEIRRGASL